MPDYNQFTFASSVFPSHQVSLSTRTSEIKTIRAILRKTFRSTIPCTPLLLNGLIHRRSSLPLQMAAYHAVSGNAFSVKVRNLLCAATYIFEPHKRLTSCIVTTYIHVQNCKLFTNNFDFPDSKYSIKVLK